MRTPPSIPILPANFFPPATPVRARLIFFAPRLLPFAPSLMGTPPPSEGSAMMSNDAFWTNMVQGNEPLPGLDDLNIPLTNETQQIYETATEVQAIDVEGGAIGSRSSRPNSKRSKNFDPKEDVVVVSAWLNVSKDPVTGANQSKGSFWSRIHAYFEQNKTTTFLRTESSIMHRWMTILAQVNKFCSCYDAIERKSKSGATIQDKISEAAEMYKGLDQENKAFTLIHCWNKLKDEDKWKAELEKNKNKKRKVQAQSTLGGQTEAPPNDEVTEIPPVQEEGEKRPPGQKKAKEALKRGGGEACMEALDKMWAKKEAFDREKEKKKEERYLTSLELEKKRVEADLMEKEDKIMSMDMTSPSLTPTQLQYYQIMQAKIIARRLSN